MYYESCTEFLAARFFDTSYIQGIFYFNQLLFTYSQRILMKYLNSKQNLSPEKGIYSYLVKFYRTIDTIYANYTGLFLVPLLCPCVSSAATL